MTLQFSPLPYEVDFTGFVSNTVATQWMERMRVRLIEQCFPEVDLNDAANLSVIRRTEVDYLRPIRFADPVLACAFVKKVMNSSWVVGFSFTCALTSNVVLEGTQTGVFIDAMTLKPKRMPLLINQLLNS